MNPLTLLQGSQMPALCLLSGALGGIIGSFLGVVVERIPPLVKGEEGAGNLLFPASHCPACSHPLSWWENIPILSWCALRGRCRCCKTAIPGRLLLLELSSALFFALTAAFAPSAAALLSLWVLWCGLLPLAAIDAKHMLLPLSDAAAALGGTINPCVVPSFTAHGCGVRRGGGICVALADLLAVSPDNRPRRVRLR